jgi:hypothetical protein
VIPASCLIVVLTRLSLAGCYVKTVGGQTTGGTTAISTQVGASAKFSAGRASFVSGQPVSPAAPGGQISLGRSGGLIVAVGLVVAEAVQYVGDLFGPGSPAPARGGSIADTCSCYQKPAMSDR